MSDRCLTQSRRDNEHNEIPGKIVDAAYAMHSNLGPGLLESVYEVALVHELVHELGKCGLKVRRQVSIPVEYDGIRFDEGSRADLVVENKVIVELKSVEQVAAVHKKQLLIYLRLSDMQLGLLINFGARLLRDGITTGRGRARRARFFSACSAALRESSLFGAEYGQT